MSGAERLLKRLLKADEPSRPDIQAWDLPTRLFKWSLVALVITAWVSSGFDDPNMTVHKAAGYGILTLVVYRVFWGFVGSSTARFSNFVRSPAAGLTYLRNVRAGTQLPYLGHNPAGGLMIVSLLLACAFQVTLGLFASDGVLASGPFADTVGETWSSRAAALHSVWFYGLLGLALVHIATNLFHQFIKRDNLIGAMITGRKDKACYVDVHESVRDSLGRAFLCLLAAIVLVYFGIVLSGGQFFTNS